MSASVSRDISAEVLKREFAFDRAMLDEEKRSVALAFSSELPVDRGGYMEILSHDSTHCDLSRLNNAHPLLLQHDPDKQIGVIEEARLDGDKKGRAVVRFSKSQLADEIWQDVKDGIRRLVSVGYRRTSEVGSETMDGREFVRFAWQPYEVSIVSIPADATVGIGRSESQTPETASRTPVIEPEKVTTMSEIVVKENRSAKDILNIVKNLGNRVPNARELADKAISEDWDVSRFQAEVLNQLPEAKPVTRAPEADISVKDLSKFSITRAINGIMSGRLSGLEAEVNQEMERQLGQSATGFWLPGSVLARNAIAGTGTLGGMVVSTPNLGSEFIELLRAKAVVGQLGARMLNLQNPVTIPRQNAAGTVNWTNGETAAATLAGINFTQLTLTPKCISAVQQYSKQLLATSNPSIDSLIRDDITNEIALAIDLAAFHGTGATGQPTGIAATTGIATVALGSNAAALSTANAYTSFVSLETEIATDNADVAAMAYVVNAATRGKLKSIGKTGTDSVFVWESGNTVNGYRTAISNQLSTILTKGTATTICTAAFFGNFSELLVADFNGGATDLVVDPYSLSVNGVVRIVARKWVDLGIRHPQSFSMIADILN
jgi:HK97 family phage major capsid protein